MYITPRQKKRYIFRMLLIALAIPVSVFGLYQASRLLTGASGDTQPRSLFLSNVTPNSVTLNWFTDQKALGEVYVIDSTGTESSPFQDTRGAGARYTHFVELTDLTPDTDYTVRINSGGESYSTIDGDPIAFRTVAVTSDTPVPNPVYGSVSDFVDDDVLVLLFKDGAQQSLPVSNVVTSTGNWIIDLSTLRSADGSSIVSVSSDTDIKMMLVGEGGLGGTTSGAYSDLVDDGGKLLASTVLSATDAEPVLTELPTSSLIGQLYASGEDPVDPDPDPDPDPGPDPDPDPDPNPDPDPDPNPNPGPIDPGPDPVIPPTPDPTDNGGYIGFDPLSRQFLNKSDIPWSDLVLGTGTEIVEPDVTTGVGSVKIVGHTDSTFSVAWLSDSKEEGYVKYGTDSSVLDTDANDVRDSIVERGEYYSHLVEISRLQPETTYYFEVYSGDDTYTNSGAAYEVTTFSTLSSPPVAQELTGSIAGYDSVDDAVVLVSLTDGDSTGTSGTSTTLATVPGSEGSWIVGIGDARSQDGAEYFSFSDQDTISAVALVYADSSPTTDSLANGFDGGIGVTVTAPTSSTVAQEVPQLVDYGIRGGAIGGTGTGGYQPVFNGTQTPNTAVGDGIGTVVFGAVIASLGGLAFLYMRSGVSGSNKVGEKFNRTSF